MASIIDFTNCKRIIGKAYNGANGKKIAIEYEGEKFMLKFPPSRTKNQQNCHPPTVQSVNI